MSFKERKRRNSQYCKRYSEVFKQLTKEQIHNFAQRISNGEQFTIDELEKFVERKIGCEH